MNDSLWNKHFKIVYNYKSLLAILDDFNAASKHLKKVAYLMPN